ncbi:peptidase T [Flavihumibacter sp. CACIAM 22H1]|uniref:peptidase T n=1 Tax=Flavihumibacter sp. CACIAM 22H1 TaxID=1812911 RepID=UPI0007A7F93C|nr:peptidase T [Flavihumibacter sp. CACIAM 22H1]KYP14890.1 MAG: peptidase T [Flavihumibacter sp. CACIAM 22H1]
MPEIDRFTVKERLMRYVQIDTQSDPYSETQPSTEKQKNLSRLLVEELQAMGIADAHLDEFGYVYATIPATSAKKVPVICFCSHVDTAPDCSGAGVRPILHTNYSGAPLVLPDDPTQVIRVEDHPYLAEKIGDDIITASGTTLLGADDKAGLAIIMDMAAYLAAKPGLQHGEIKILFTPDEEIGRGVDKVDLKKLGASVAYTLDAGELGSLEDENFSADAMTVYFHGIAAHPGSAKGKMINALKLAGEFLAALPKEKLAPEVTEGREGFVHPVRMAGGAELAQVDFIIRDFDTQQLGEHEYLLQHLADEVVLKYPGARTSYEVKEQYRNMKEVLKAFPNVVALAEEAMKRSGIRPRNFPIRGGTDGARLSFMGLPCPNLFTGEMSLHSKQEYVSVQDMEKSVRVLLELVQLWERNS